MIYNGDCFSLLRAIPDGQVDLVCTDPPFNIGYPYDLYQDKKGYTEYQDWCRAWIKECHRVLKADGSIYVCIGDEYAAEINLILKQTGFIQRGWLIWRYGFGVACKKKFQRCHTHIHWFSKSETYTFNDGLIRVPSDRMKYGDKRADPRGKIPSDVWDFPRVCGTFKERIKDADGKTAHSCQMNSDVIERCVLTSSSPRELVLDPFCGSGTTAFVARRHDRRFLTSEISEKYAKVAAKRLFGDEMGFVRELPPILDLTK
jgi:DNA modification methylase